MTQSRRIRIGSRDALVANVVEHVSRAAHHAICARGIFSIALPGGSVAEAIVPVLAKASVPWQCVHVFWCDERAVPESDLDSNVGLTRRLWPAVAGTSTAQLHPMPGGAANLSAAALAYMEELTAVVGTPPVLDTVLLGVGADGHVASLFPGRPSLNVRHSAVVVESHAPKPPSARLTLTLPVLVGARETVVIAFGAEKAQAIGRALEDPWATTPVARALREANRVLVMLDDEAAGQLTHTKLERLV